MSVVLVTGSAGLIGAETVRFFAAEGFDVVGIDNDMRRVLFGDHASTAWSGERLQAEVTKYEHVDGDIRDPDLLESVFGRKGRAICAVVHTAAQPSHDWAARDPQTDFGINANGRSTCLKPLAGIAQMRLLYLPVQTRFMATHPIYCRWSRERRGGR